MCNYFFQVGHPEPLLSSGHEGRSDGVLKHLVNPIVREYAGLVVVESQLVCNATSLIRHHEVVLARGTHERAALAEVAEVGLIPVHVPQIVLAPHQQNGGLRTEAPDLGVPHKLAVAQGHRTVHREAQQDYIWTTVRKPNTNKFKMKKVKNNIINIFSNKSTK